MSSVFCIFDYKDLNLLFFCEKVPLGHEANVRDSTCLLETILAHVGDILPELTNHL